MKRAIVGYRSPGFKFSHAEMVGQRHIEVKRLSGKLAGIISTLIEKALKLDKSQYESYDGEPEVLAQG